MRKSLFNGQIYATLQRLERDGQVAVSGTAQESGPERIVYEITDCRWRPSCTRRDGSRPRTLDGACCGRDRLSA